MDPEELATVAIDVPAPIMPLIERLQGWTGFDVGEVVAAAVLHYGESPEALGDGLLGRTEVVEGEPIEPARPVDRRTASDDSITKHISFRGKGALFGWPGAHAAGYGRSMDSDGYDTVDERAEQLDQALLELRTATVALIEYCRRTDIDHDYNERAQELEVGFLTAAAHSLWRMRLTVEGFTFSKMRSDRVPQDRSESRRHDREAGRLQEALARLHSRLKRAERSCRAVVAAVRD